jgi:Flp pilus assembly secretin CpaC
MMVQSAGMGAEMETAKNTLFVLAAMLFLSGTLACAQPTLRMEIALAGTEVVRTSEPVNTIAVGDPNIADVSIINENAILITGKKIGTTGFVLLNRTGHEILRRTLRVGAEQKPVRVLDGTPEGVAYVCAPLCTPAQDQERLLARGVNENRQGSGAATPPPP